MVVGGGVLGLSLGVRLLERGFAVTLIEQQKAGYGAGWASAGMLCPWSEAILQPRPVLPLLKLGTASLALWPQWVERLEDYTGEKLHFQIKSSLHCALTEEELQELEGDFQQLQKLEAPITWLTGEDIHRREPALTPSVLGGFLLSEETCLEPRALMRVLLKACQKLGGVVMEETRALDLIHKGGSVKGVRIQGWGGDTGIEGENVVLAAGFQSAQSFKMFKSLPLAPVKGQALAFGAGCSLQHVIRGSRVYMAPSSERLICGASTEYGRSDILTDSETIQTLQKAAQAFVPALGEMQESWAGIRPATPDGLPLIGPYGPKGLFIATGHYRHGLCLSPETARIITSCLEGEAQGHLLQAFDPERFEKRQGEPAHL